MAANPPPAEGEIRQILVHPAVWTALDLWLQMQGLELNLINPGDELPTYAMSPAQWVIDAANREAAAAEPQP